MQSKQNTIERTTLTVEDCKMIPARHVLSNPSDSDAVACLFSKDDLEVCIDALEKYRHRRAEDLAAGMKQLKAAAFPESPSP